MNWVEESCIKKEKEKEKEKGKEKEKEKEELNTVSPLFPKAPLVAVRVTVFTELLLLIT